jgi:arabinofuranosyltransferase
MSTKTAGREEMLEGTTSSPVNAQLKYWYWACAAAAGLFYLIFIWKNSFMVNGQRFFSLFDDAMISMRYAKNLADGYGLRWNPGEAPVEGYTNFLWTLYMAAIHLLPIAASKTSSLVMLTGVVILLFNLLVVKSIAERIVGKNSYVPLMSVFLTAFYYPLIYWTLRGMKVGFLCLLTDLAILLVLRLQDRYLVADVWWLTLVCCAALLTRPDAIVPEMVVCVFLIFVMWQSGFKPAYLIIPAAVVAVAAGQTAFRVAYYGDPLPNTYYLKVAGVSLVERGSHGLLMLLRLGFYHLWPVLLILAVALGANFKRLLSPKVLLLLGVVAGQAAYSVYVGGDAWDFTAFSNRYITIAMPALFVALGLALTICCQYREKALLATIPVWGIGLLVQGNYYFTVKHPSLSDCNLALTGFLIAFIGAGLLLLKRCRCLGPATVPVVTLLLVCLTMNTFGVASWFLGLNNGWLILEDTGGVRNGLLLRQATTPDVTIAYVGAGGAPYFAGRRAIDLLGKSDPLIAKSQPVTGFVPGHNKWNYEYSIGKLQPDLVMELWKATDLDRKMMTNWGYIPICHGWYLRGESANKVNMAILCPSLQSSIGGTPASKTFGDGR